MPMLRCDNHTGSDVTPKEYGRHEEAMHAALAAAALAAVPGASLHATAFTNLQGYSDRCEQTLA